MLDIMPFDPTYDNSLLNRLTVEKVLTDLSEEERDIIIMWMSGSFTLGDIGRVIGQKYHREDIKSSVIRYHRDKILRRLRETYNKSPN